MWSSVHCPAGIALDQPASTWPQPSLSGTPAPCPSMYRPCWAKDSLRAPLPICHLASVGRRYMSETIDCPSKLAISLAGAPLIDSLPSHIIALKMSREAQGETWMAVAQAGVRKPIPFDVHHLDSLLDEAGIDVLVATSKHNVQYLLGDYKFFFFEAMDAIGVNRYLPAVVYQKGKPETAAYVGNSMEAYEKELGKFWPQSLYLSTWSGPQTMQRVVEHVGKLGPGVRRVGIEAAFLPVDAEKELRGGLSNVDFVDAYFALERLRAVKSPQEIEFLKLASERVVESMNIAFGQCAPGKTKQEIAET